MPDLQIGDVIQAPGANVPMGPRPTIPQIRDQPVQPPDTGGLINLFKSWFHRQSDLDDVMKQMQPQQGIPGVNGAIPPPAQGLRQSALPNTLPEMAGVRG